MLQRVKENLEKSHISSETKVLLAISGGVDSIVLCDVLLKLGIPFGLAHCNFSLRGLASDSDQQLVEQLAERFDVSLHLIQFDTKKEAKQRGESIQIVARELRYDWFRVLQKEFSYDAIFTGHHLNDRVETALINLTRGTGLSGLRSIKLKSQDIIRPLYSITKKELYAYAKANELSWREDKSNEDNKYARNLIRNEVVPLFEQLNPSFVENSVATFERLSDTELIYKEAVKEKINKVKSNNSVDIEGLQGLIGAKQILYEILAEYGFNYQQSVQVFDSLDGISGRVFYAGNYSVIIDREKIFIESNNKVESKSPVNNWKENESFSCNGISFLFKEIEKPTSLITDVNTVNLSLERLSDDVFIRKWELGDKIRPFGMKGKQKKVSDILIDAKVPLHEKDKVLVLVSNEEIVWVVGYCFSEEFAVKKSDKTICQVNRIEE